MIHNTERLCVSLRSRRTGERERPRKTEKDHWLSTIRLVVPLPLAAPVPLSFFLFAVELDLPGEDPPLL